MNEFVPNNHMANRRFKNTEQLGASRFVIVINKNNQGDQIKADCMGKACGTHGGGETCIQICGAETWKRPLDKPRSKKWALLLK